MIVRRGVVLIELGLVIGTPGALAFAGLLQGFLWEVTPTDPATFSIVPAALATISLVACYAAARRALKVDPAVVLRQELELRSQRQRLHGARKAPGISRAPFDKRIRGAR